MTFNLVDMNIARPRFSLDKHFTEAPYFPTMWVAEGDVRLPSLNLHKGLESGAFGYVVSGDLIVEGSLESFSEEALTLLVTGDLIVSDVVAGGAEVVVLGDLRVSHFLVAQYNHGRVEVAGDLHAPYLLISDHDVQWGGSFYGEGAEVFHSTSHSDLKRQASDVLPALRDEDGLLDLKKAVVHLKTGASPFLESRKGAR